MHHLSYFLYLKEACIPMNEVRGFGLSLRNKQLMDGPPPAAPPAICPACLWMIEGDWQDCLRA